jgi:hypothetical protein
MSPPVLCRHGSMWLFLFPKIQNILEDKQFEEVWASNPTQHRKFWRSQIQRMSTASTRISVFSRRNIMHRKITILRFTEPGHTYWSSLTQTL